MYILLYPVFHKMALRRKGEKKYSMKWFCVFFYLDSNSVFYLFLTSGNGKQPEMKLYHKAELQKRIHVPTVV